MNWPKATIDITIEREGGGTDLYLSCLRQTSPFWINNAPDEAPALIKYLSDFDLHWATVLDENGSYVDDTGQRVAVKRRLEDGSLSEIKDMHWAAYNAALAWCIGVNDLRHMDTAMVGPPSVMWLTMLRAMRILLKDEVQDLAVREMRHLRARIDDKSEVMVHASRFAYPSLLQEPRALRLVVLLPSTDNGSDISCILCNSTLDRSEKDQYEALSYVWGHPSRKRQIKVSNQPFQATENLEAALRSLRYRDKPRVLWIDAMCINQNDVAERNAQVRQMGLIYQRAQRVIIWLGPESEDSSDAMEFLSYRPYPDRDGLDAVREEQYWNLVRPRLLAVHRLLKRPWFTRVWCIQEFALSKAAVFKCGHPEVSWEDLVAFTRLFTDHGLSIGLWQSAAHMQSTQESDVWEVLMRFVQLSIWKMNAMDASGSALALLATFRSWGASDSRDLIFGLDSLVSDENPDKVAMKPDYSLNIAELYLKIAIHFLEHHRDLNILYMATQPVQGFADTSRVHYMPTWVPDWRDTQRFGPPNAYQGIAIHVHKTFLVSFDDAFDVSFGLEATPITLLEDRQVLCLDGISVDSISLIGDMYSELDENSKEVLADWKRIAGVDIEGEYPFTGQSIREAFWRTLLLDLELPSLLKSASRVRMPATNVKLESCPSFPPDDQNEHELMQNVIGRGAARMNGRRFFKTEKRLIGLAPASARQGDRVAVLFGGRAPFILREFEWYQVIGESYVHGIMDGEVLHQPRRVEFQHYSTETFQLA